MEGIIYYALVLGSVAFAVVVIYLCVLLKRVSNSMKTVGQAFEKVEAQLHHITPELKRTLQETGELIDDTEVKLKATDSVVDTIGNLGTSVQTVNKIYEHKKENVSEQEIFEQAKPFIEGIKWSEAIVQVFSNWKRNKPSNETALALKNEKTNVVPLKQTRKRDNQ